MEERPRVAVPAPVQSYADLERTLRDSTVADALGEITEDRGQVIVRYAPERRLEVLAVLKAMGFTLYSFCAPVDWPDQDRIEILDHVYSVERRQRVTAKCDLPRNSPRVDSATGVYAGADWHEREAHEMMGVFFAGHPRLRRLLLPDWFEGFPLRKDFELAARVEKPWPGESFSG